MVQLGRQSLRRQSQQALQVLLCHLVSLVSNVCFQTFYPAFRHSQDRLQPGWLQLHNQVS